MSQSPQFISLLTAYQNRLYAYILSLLGDPAAAEEVLQQANLVIWEKSGDFEAGSDFEAWVMTIARFEVKAWRARVSRDRLVFSDAAFANIETASRQLPGMLEQRIALLHDCFGRLTDRQRQLIQQRYQNNQTLDDLARGRGESRSVIAQALYRARLALVRCMQRKLHDEGAA